VAPENWGNLLQHLTGSGKHNEAMRTDAVKDPAAGTAGSTRSCERWNVVYVSPWPNGSAGVLSALVISEGPPRIGCR
jgi:hypothetical protein